MGKETRRFMRMLVFFDLPMVTKAERKSYTQFRRFLLNDGYDMRSEEHTSELQSR